MNDYTEKQLSELYKTFASKDSFLVKVSTSVLTKGTERIDALKIDDIVDQIAALHKDGKTTALVTSGARQAGRAHLDSNLEYSDTVALDQAFSSIGQPYLMELYNTQLRKHGLRSGQILLEYDHMIVPDKIENIRNTIRMLNRLNAIPIFNENDPVAIDEITLIEPSQENAFMRIGDNDVLSAKAASQFGYGVLFMLTNTNGFLYDGNGAKFNVVDTPHLLWDHVTDAKSHLTKGGMRSKLKAIEEATSNNIYVSLISGVEDDSIVRALNGEPLGTLFLPKNYKNSLQDRL